VETSPDAIALLDVDGTIKTANKKAANLVNLDSAEDLVGKSYRDFMPDGDETAFPQRLKNTLEHGGRESIAANVLRCDGTTVATESSSSVIRNKQGDVQGIIVVVRDVTKQRRVETELRRSEQQFRQLFESVNDGIVVVTKSGRLADCNRAMHESLGYTREEFLDLRPENFVHPGYHELLWANLEKLRSGKSILSDSIHVCKDGSEIPVEVNSRTVEYRGKPAILAVFRDITERKQTEKALREREEIYRLLVESSPNVITMSGLDGKIMQVNHRAAEMLGLESEEELIGKSGYDLVVPEEREDFKKRLMASFDDGVSKEIEFTFTNKRGERRTGGFIASVLKDDMGKPKAVMTTVRDVTEYKLAENALRESETLYRTLFESVPVGIGLATLEGQILAVNPAMCCITGYSEEEWKKANVIASYQNPDDRIPFLKHLRENGFASNYEVELKRADGTAYLANLASTCLSMGEKEVLLTVVEDITERRQAQKQLQSLASQLSLAEEKERRRIATELHDNVGQILAAAKMRLGRLRERINNSEQESEIVELKKLCEQAIALTRSLTFELSPPVLYELGLEPALEWLLKKHAEQEGIETEFASDAEPKPLDDDILVLLFQSVRELLNNVARHSRASRVAVSIARESGNIQVVVEDDGAGFDVSALGESDGFGLFNIRERLSCLGGTFSLQSSPGGGTRIVIAAPLETGVDAGEA
jgi:PAS domain S-box-containing protein